MSFSLRKSSKKKKRVLLENFAAAAAMLGETWNAEAEFSEEPIAGESFEHDGVAHFFLRSSDRPEAVVIVPVAESDSESSRKLIELTQKLLFLIRGEDAILRSFSAPAKTALPEAFDFQRFVCAAQPGWELLFNHEVSAAAERFIAERSPKESARAVEEAFAAPVPETRTPNGLAISEPASARGASFFFPFALLAGETPIRFFPRSAMISAGDRTAEDPANRFSWHQYVVKAGGASYGGFWAFRAPEGVDPARFAAISASVAKAAALAIAREFARYGLADAAPAASKPVPAPKLGASTVFHLDGAVAVGGTRFEVRIFTPTSYPKSLAASLKIAAADPLDAFLLFNRGLAEREKVPFAEALATTFRSDPVPNARAPNGILFVPFYEYLGILSDDDYRRFVQGFFSRRCQNDELVQLLFYRKTVQGPDGAPKRIVVKPNGMDFNRLLGALPRSLKERVVDQVKAGGSSPTTDDFLKRNEDAYEAAVEEYRRGSLELGRRAADCLELLYTRHVYAAKRKRLDAMIEKDYPMAALRGLPQSAFRRAIDLTDFRMISASFIGRDQGLNEIVRWCSKRKLENIREELRRLNSLLDRGAIDPDEVCSLRSELAKKAAEAVKREREERQKEFAREVETQERPRNAPERVKTPQRR